VLADETIAASGLVFRVFTTNALVDITIKATDALCSRQQQTATSEKAVEMQRGELRMTGEGFEWNGTNGTLRIRRQARITFPSEMIKAEGVLDHVR
jgi:lipopolysaccharide export system protein LptC